MYKRDIYLDIDDNLNNYIKSVELDSNSRVWHFHLTVDYEPLDLTGKSVQFRAEKPDKTNVLNDCKIVDAEKGVVEVKLTRQVNAIPGHVKCLLKIIGDEGFVLKTKTFVVDVSKTLSDDTIVSSDEFGALEAALGKVQDIDNRFAQTNAQLSQITHSFDVVESGIDDIIDTENIRNAISDAVNKNATILKFPYKKRFIITPNEGTGKGEPTFVIPSNLEIDLNECEIKVKPNNYTGYNIFTFPETTSNSTLKNGYLTGDRHEHIYTTGVVNSTHEFGCGVDIKGTNNTIKNLIIKEMTGDGVYLGGYSNNNWHKRIFSGSFKRNSLDTNGALIDSTTDIVSEIMNISDYISDINIYNLRIEPYYGGTIPFVRDKMVTVAFYNNGTFVESITQLDMTEILIPKNCNQFRILFTNANIDFDDDIFIHESKVGRFNTVKNNEIFDCRRQGISTSLNEQCKIQNNIIHTINGTLPKSGIDIEDSRFALNGLIIENNLIYNTNNSCIICYDGFGITIKNNKLVQKKLGCIVTDYSEGLTIEDNILYGFIKIGAKGSKRLYKDNYIKGNIIKNNTSTGMGCTFYNCYLVNNSFENLGINGVNSVFNFCNFFDTKNTNATNNLSIQGDSIYNDCKIESLFSKWKRITFSGAEINRSTLNADQMFVTVFKGIKSSEIKATTSSHFYFNGEVVSIEKNEIQLGSSTTHDISINCDILNLNDNIFNMDGWYTFFTMDDVLDKNKLVKINNNIFNGNNVTSALFCSGLKKATMRIYENQFSITSGKLLSLNDNVIESKIFIKDNTGNYTLPESSDVVFIADSFM